MKFLFDLFPVILFFAMFKWGEANPDAALALAQKFLSGVVAGGEASAAQAPIMLATGIAIVATFAQIGYLLLRGRKVDTMLWVSLAIITLFGGATIYFHNETFIKWKPTVLYWLFGAALLFAQLALGRNLIRLMMEKQITLPDDVWQKLNLSWAGFFSVMGLVNLYVAYTFPTAFWVNFKLFGFTGMMIAFVIAQSMFLSKYVKDSR
ncbi:MAG TPA: septation protein A [Noviherbaspirillum sp.]|uniref:septation protein A n=1 Tax=Noviherbaspirillum sp. TaxID=1926288 RepID=UPI002D5C3328|nr:septation protein A [Noviherbaspirillum sp.]HYD97362.1 septation protein A [Noviherbaspirillum sp.]